MAIALLALGCTPAAPTGQVVALVDGTEITRRELIFEIESDPILRHLDGPAAQQAAMQALVNRKLLSGAATQALLDRSPEFIAARRRMAEIMLADRFMDRLAGEAGKIDAQVIARFIAANPSMFANRQTLGIARLEVPKTWIEGFSGTISSADRERIAALCKARQEECKETVGTVDTQMLEPDEAQALVQRSPDRPWIETQEAQDKQTARVVVAKVVFRHPRSASPEADRARAADVLSQVRQRKALAAVLEHLSTKASISYQQGFKP